MIPYLIVGAVVVLVGGLGYVTWQSEKRRTAALQDLAVRLGFNFVGKVGPETVEAMGPFHLFKHGHAHQVKNLMRGRAEGADVTLFDYQYTTGGGKDSHTYRQTVALFPGAPGASALPDFTLGPEHWWNKLGKIFGQQDITFEASPEFSKAYLLKGPNEQAIRAAFGAEALGFLAQNQGWSVQSASGALAVFMASKLCKPEDLQAFLAQACAVRRTLVRD
jgi:hypothetical protein